MDMEPAVTPPAPEAFWRSSRQAPLATALGMAAVALLSQWLLPHSAYTVITSTLFTRDTWLHDDAWSAAFMCLSVAWWFGARPQGHRTYRLLPIVVAWVGSYVVQAVTFIGLLMAANHLTLDAGGRAQATDLVALASVSLFIYIWMRTTIGRTIGQVPASAGNRRHAYGLGLAAAVFALATLAKAAPCGTVDCRADALRRGVGEEVVRFVETYIRASPAISQDVGAVQHVALRAGTRSRVDVWMDYDAELFLEVQGARGNGMLDLTLAGNSYRELGSSVGWWRAGGRRVPLDNRGAIDTIALRAEATRAQDVKLAAARAKADCAAILTLIAQNDAENRRGTAFPFDHRDVSLWRAECAEKAGDRRQAADAYAQYAARLRPMPFNVEPDDAARARSAQAFLTKAIALDPESPNRHWWATHLKVLQVQERFAQHPGDHALCLELKQALAEGRSHYPNACQ